jgi:hypothetical protein
VLKAYTGDPVGAYRGAKAEVRKALDRWLVTEARRRALELRAEADPLASLALAREALGTIPDRPEVAAALQRRGLAEAPAQVARLRRVDVLELRGLFEREGKGEEGRALLRAWLEAQRKKLGDGDAEGRVLLAEEYLAQLADRPVAAELLLEAVKLDGSYRAATEALRRLGYRQEGGTWAAPADGAPAATAGVAADGAEPLMGLSPDEVKARLGTPDRRSIEVTQGTLVQQWFYQGARGARQVVVFHNRPGNPPTVVSRFAIP